MAGDWIKMRVGLVTHPKVMRLAECLVEHPDYLEWSALSYAIQSFPPPTSDQHKHERHAALRVTRYVTVCALLRFWGYANEHIDDDETISGLWPDDVDEIAGIPGFSDSMQAIGWLEFDEKRGLAKLPNFHKYNVSATNRGMTNAERQKNYRDRKKAGIVTNSVTNERNVTRNVTNNAREEKRRDINTIAFDPTSYLKAKEVPDQIIADWLALRKAKRAKVTKTAIEGIEKQAAIASLSLAQTLQKCCERGWQGFSAEWVTGNSAPVMRPDL